MTVTFAEKLARIPGYQAGVPTGQAPEAIAAGGIAQLASNESPVPPHPKVVEAIRAAAGAMNRYPDPDATLLRRRIADRYEVEPGRVAVGNGSCEILLADFPNLVVLRTFSKVYGLAGLRVGFALGSAKFRAAVDAVRQPFSVNALAQAAGAEAILHQDDVEQRVERTLVERVRVEAGLQELDLSTAETQTNFSWIDLGDADELEVVAGLAEQAIAVRPGTPLGDAGHIRVSYGTPAENDRFLAAMAELLD
jgi:histidinol-phosphate/aromatic aminotransferase/cobyric acid decarboxylase-like protein